ncbi:GNAT family N-acetyltransferase [Paenibacillus sediminis]|uniref:RimJ/RimL family protein N-acetyltransferase n=1 Tax=Paenibacillus sediminis TaxID=664909 RepID=A0ABS4H386_9BACL|nr:RimJ/RimL family protein N-acetyltransferase [Paenibacillus sediminis]
MGSVLVLSSNTAAINFYLKCGFEIQGRLVEEFYINDQFVDDIMMFKMVN